VYYFVDPIVTTQRSINMLISIGVAFSIFVCHRVSFFVLLFFNFVFFLLDIVAGVCQKIAFTI
jgi:hypothetical protein